MGSIRSRRWRKIFESEVQAVRDKFSVEILSRHKTRQDAILEEYRLQKKYDVVRSDKYFNEAYATVNGSHGRDVSGSNNPMFGRKNEVNAINTTSGEKVRVSRERFENDKDLCGHTIGSVYVKQKNTGEIVKISKEEYATNKNLYIHLNQNRKASLETKKKLSSQRRGYSTCQDWNGMFYRVRSSYPRVLSGQVANIGCKRWMLTDPQTDEKYFVLSLITFCNNSGLVLRRSMHGSLPVVIDRLTRNKWGVIELINIKDKVPSIKKNCV